MTKQEPEKLKGTSLDIAEDNRLKLKQLFPTVFTETVNEKGELVESIDFEKLKAEMGLFSDLFESRREPYGLLWAGKKEALKLIQTHSNATLKPCKEESVNFDSTENLFIEGDNLEVLKLLQKSYYGKVKMIYIDPPYNTGKEFIYPDNYTESLDTYLEYAGLIDGEGKKFSTNTANEGRFHTKWLNMMYPRLYLARNLLRDDGVIFISIDDNEVSNLRKLCDEIFGEENFVCDIIRKTKSTTNDAKSGVNIQHESCLTYSKNIDFLLLRGEEKQFDNYSNPDNDPLGEWTTSDPTATDDGRKTKNISEIINPYTGKIDTPGLGRRWRFNQEGFSKLLSERRIVFKQSHKENERGFFLKRYKNELQDDRKLVDTLFIENVFLNQAATKELYKIFNEKYFDFPKPANFIYKLIQYTSFDEDNDIILDFFAGSATTAHALLDLNKQDNGNRKFIMVQLPEPCPPESEAFKAGYKTIADIGKARIRKVIDKLNQENDGKFDFGDAHVQDRGFKVLKLDKSNFKEWQQLDPSASVEEIEQELFNHIDHIDPKSTPEDLLYEILLKAGFTLTEKIETVTIADTKVFSIADGGLLLCLEKSVTKELIDAVAEAEPMHFICLDSAFHGNDQLKANAVQTFAARNMQREKHNQIKFETV